MSSVKKFLIHNFVPRIPSKDEGALDPEMHVESEVIELDELKVKKGFGDEASVHDAQTMSTTEKDNTLHRSLKGRHVQLLGIGATIGSGLFVSIGQALATGGPLNLLLGFMVWTLPILCITLSTAEMVSYLPIASPFVRLAGRCCDEALEIMTAWNFWFLCCAQIPFEVTQVNAIIHFWRDDYPVVITLIVQVVLYFLINIFDVGFYGEVEFWMSLGKIVLATGLILFTFITMLGGNPQHDTFGFRYWKHPGPMNTYDHTGSLGRFQGFLTCLIRACFTFAGPEYVSTVASETINPRKVLPSAFKQVFFRLLFFFIGGALAVGILVAYDDVKLNHTLGASNPGESGSPYIIAMQNMHIDVLPDIVNALLVTAAFSAGNSYTYCSSRTLYGVALSGYAPRIFKATTGSGIPLYCMLVSLAWAMISFLQLGESASVVLDWIINLITSCQLMNFCILCFTYIFFYRAMKAQGMDRRSLPLRGWFQPWLAVFGFISAFVMIFVCSYEIFQPGKWDYKTFIFTYLMVFVNIVIFVGVKIIKRTKWKNPHEVDLTTGLREVELHEEQYAQLQREKQEKGNGKLNIFQKLFSFAFGSRF